MSAPAVNNTAADNAAVLQQKHHAVTGPSLWLTALAAVVFFLLFALGSWQVYRWQWKLDLITRVEQRVHQMPQNPPAATEWASLHRDNAEYRRVRLQGRWLHGKSQAVLASTIYGSGYWIITPLQQSAGEIILVNRGFVKDLTSLKTQQEQLEQLVDDEEGLLRLSETGGRLLRQNDAQNQRWYSRGVAALAKAMGLVNVAPYFVDLAYKPGSAAALAAQDPYYQPDLTQPVPGLTIIHFANNHVVYALTWFTLAIMVAGGYAYVRRVRPSRGEDGDSN